MSEETKRGKQLEPEVQLALACLIFLPSSMRGSRIVAMLTEAIRNPALARELQANPRAVFERRCGHIIPVDTSIEVHLSTADSIHLVLPISSAQPAHTQSEITDEDLLSARSGRLSYSIIGAPNNRSLAPLVMTIS